MSDCPYCGQEVDDDLLIRRDDGWEIKRVEDGWIARKMVGNEATTEIRTFDTVEGAEEAIRHQKKQVRLVDLHMDL